MYDALWNPVRIGALELPHRLGMAPVTGDRPAYDGTPAGLNAGYYGQRASMGLLITEGTQPSPDGQGYPLTPGIHAEDHVAGWRRVADAVHAGGGRLVIQLMHTGRISHPGNTPRGRQPVAPSAVAAADQMPAVEGMLDFPAPRELSLDEIGVIVDDFRQAAAAAIRAGVDGVEIHGGDGCLVHQFLSSNANQRTDAYGGSIENRIRFAVEVATAVAGEIGADRAGIRISPGNPLNDIAEADTRGLYLALAAALAPLGLAYLHVVAAAGDPLLKELRAAWPAALLVNVPGAPLEERVALVADGIADLVTVGQLALAKPDLVQRLRAGAVLNEPDRAAYYGGDHRGYTDYPILSGRPGSGAPQPAAAIPPSPPASCTVPPHAPAGHEETQPAGSRESGPGGLGLWCELFANSPAAVAYVAGSDLVFEFASDGYRQVLGRRDLIGRPFREALPEAVGQPLFEDLRRVLQTGEPRQVSGQVVPVHRPGAQAEPTYLDSVYQPAHDETGRVAGVLIFCTDVSERVRDRQQLEELVNSLQRSEERYRFLFETMPHGIIQYEGDGSVIAANPAAVEILNLAPDQMADRAGLTVHEDGRPFRLNELPSVIALHTGEMVPEVIAEVRDARTDENRWVRITAVPDAPDAQGRPRHGYSVFTDVTEQRRTQATLRENNRLLSRLREGNIGVLVSTEKGIEEANDAYLDIVGYTRHDIETGRITWRSLTPPEWIHADDAGLEELRYAGAAAPYEKEYLHRDGHRVPVLIGAAVLDRNPLRWTTIVVDLSARQRGEQERAELLAREQAARMAADAAQDRLALLLGAGSLLAATGDEQELREQTAKLMVPALADSCTVLLLTPQGMLRTESVVHRNPAKQAILEELRAIDLPPDGTPLHAALTRGTPQLVTDSSNVVHDWSCAGPTAVDILTRATPTSMIVIPTLIGQRLVGAVVLGRGGKRPRFTEADVAVIEELYRRLAIGMANVEAFAREHTVAETLQHALMPDASPQIAGLDLAARYLPATDGVHVGGDWYDVFPLDRDRVALAIGDVAGHSIGSASIMGQIRSLLRAYTLDHPAPADVLQRTNAAVCELLPHATATVFYGVLDLRTGDLAYANAGHPPALLRSGEGHVEYLDGASGTMLGAGADTSYTTGHQRLALGASLLLYTDGLVEDRRRDIAEGFSYLARAVRLSPVRSAEQTCHFVQAAMLGSRTRADDVCIFTIRLQDQPEPG